MGKSITPKYRVEIVDNSLSLIKMAWEGRANDQILADYIKAYINSLKIGGANAHISLSLGFMPIPNHAEVIEQRTGKIVASWNAPMFMEI